MDAVGSQMDVDGSGFERPVPKESFDGQEVSAVLIQMCAKRMAKMGRSPFPPLCRVWENGE